MFDTGLLERGSDHANDDICQVSQIARALVKQRDQDIQQSVNGWRGI
jgi:hypothetical protein